MFNEKYTYCSICIVQNKKQENFFPRGNKNLSPPALLFCSTELVNFLYGYSLFFFFFTFKFILFYYNTQSQWYRHNLMFSHKIKCQLEYPPLHNTNIRSKYLNGIINIKYNITCTHLNRVIYDIRIYTVYSYDYCNNRSNIG